MKAVHKFPFEIKEFQQIDVPRGAVPLLVGVDPKGVPAIWFEVDTQKPVRPVVIYVFGTGHEITEDATIHLGSFVWKHTSTVWHVYTV